jgi:hypothetical protein
MMPTHLLFTGDGLRSATGDADQLANVRWLDWAIGGVLRTVTGLPSELRLPVTGGTVADLVELQGGRLGIDGWATMFWQEPSGHLVEAIATACAGALVVGIELPPVLQKAMDRGGIPWIDVGVSPLRFLPDWALHVRASRHFSVIAAQHALLHTDEVQAAVRHVGAYYANPALPGPTPVFFAQTSRDRTLIKNEGFCAAEDALALVAEAAGGRSLLLKPHPWEPDNPVVHALVQAGARITEENTYALLSHPAVEVLTLSSSVGREARAWGRVAHIGHPVVQDWMFSGVNVHTEARSAVFWAPLLESGGLQCVDRRYCIPWRPNALRERIGGQGLDLEVWTPRAPG